MAIMDAVDRWYRANNAGDVEAIMATLTPTGTFSDPALGGAHSGDDLRAVLASVAEHMPDCHFEVVSAGATSDVAAAAQWVMTATHQATGRPIRLEGADFFTYDPTADALSSVVGYFDQQQIRRQLT
jgi:steroid delta-isomerase-like uncharacterized protein